MSPISYIVQRMQNPFTGFLAFVTGTTVSVTELVREGSPWLILFSTALAVLGGIWTYRTGKIRFKIEQVNLKLVELELERANNLENGHPKRHHHRREIKSPGSSGRGEEN